MSLDLLPAALARPAEVLAVDLLLAGDNAVMIALVCQGLPPRVLRPALLLGTLGAVVLRVGLTLAAAGLLALPGLGLLGGAVLALVAASLAQGGRAPTRPAPPAGVLAAALLVALIDVLMSLDNALALAAVAGGSVGYLTVGLVLSILCVMFGAAALIALMRRAPRLVLAGVAVLGWVAGGLAVGDPLVAPWIAVQAPALPVIVPLLAAGYAALLGAGRAGLAAVPAPSPAAPPPPRRAPQPRRRPAPPPPAPAPEPAMAAGVEEPVRGKGEIYLFIAMFGIAGAMLAVMVLLGG